MGLFIVLLLISLISLFVGLIKPSLFARFLGVGITRKKIGLLFGGATLVLFVLIGVTAPKSATSPTTTPTLTTSPVITQKIQEKKVEKPVNPTANKTDQQILEENLASIVSSVGGRDMGYRNLQIEKTASDRPKDTKMITVSVNVKSIFNKKSLLRDTGKLSSSVFKAVYDIPSIKAYDVLVWYYGETTDKYGNKKDDVILVYTIDKATYDKINWQNFNQSNLCDFLKQEAKSSPFDTVCNVLVNIQ